MIYILDQDPRKTAEYLDDKSLDKMIKDIAQALCNVSISLRIDKALSRDNYALSDTPLDYSLDKKILAWKEWARECEANYLYLVELGMQCGHEINSRGPQNNKKTYNALKGIVWARDNVPDLPIKCPSYNKGMTEFPAAKPKYLRADTIRTYRNYYKSKLYKEEKNSIYITNKGLHAVWTERNKPEWLS